MPILTFDLIKGRTEAELGALLDAAHSAVLEAFGVPARDRYQIVHEHEPGRMRVEDTGLGIDRSRDLVVIRVLTRPRTRDAKLALYRLLAEKLAAACGIASTDLVVSVQTNADEDWSFANGVAQFLSGDLPR